MPNDLPPAVTAGTLATDVGLALGLTGDQLAAVDALLASLVPPHLRLAGDPLLTVLAVVAALTVLLLLAGIVAAVSSGAYPRTVLAALAHLLPVASAARPKKSLTLLLGPTGAGKTSLFTLLRYGKLAATQSSLDSNDATFPINERLNPSRSAPVHVHDLPGHSKLRYRLPQLLASASKVVLVVDAGTILRNTREAGELLADVLGWPGNNRHAIPICIALNKCDGILAANEARARTALEQELEKVRSTRSASLDSQDDTGAREWEYFGVDGQPFKFDQVANEVSFAELSIRRVAEALEKEGSDISGERGFLDLVEFVATR